MPRPTHSRDWRLFLAPKPGQPPARRLPTVSSCIFPCQFRQHHQRQYHRQWVSDPSPFPLISQLTQCCTQAPYFKPDRLIFPLPAQSVCGIVHLNLPWRVGVSQLPTYPMKVFLSSSRLCTPPGAVITRRGSSPDLTCQSPGSVRRIGCQCITKTCRNKL